jgi:hypothetical protein
VRESEDKMGPRIKVDMKITIIRAGKIRRIRAMKKSVKLFFDSQLLVTRKPLIVKKMNTPTVLIGISKSNWKGS